MLAEYGGAYCAALSLELVKVMSLATHGLSYSHALFSQIHMDGVFLHVAPGMDILGASLTFPSLGDLTYKAPGWSGTAKHTPGHRGSAQGSSTKLTPRTILFGLSILCLDLPKQVTKKLVGFKTLSSGKHSREMGPAVPCSF